MEEVADKQEAELLEPVDDQVLPEERQRSLVEYGLSRMKTEWGSSERIVMERVRDMAERKVIALFLDAYEIREDIYSIVRREAVDRDTGEPLRDAYGLPVYQRRATGGYIEDWSRLTVAEKEGFLLRIATGLFEWQQNSADLWGEAMMAKASWNGRFSQAYAEKPPRQKWGTIEDRTAEGHMGAADERYHAIFLAYLSKRAEALVRSMEALMNALKVSIKS
jgi:hypothetical protein